MALILYDRLWSHVLARSDKRERPLPVITLVDLMLSPHRHLAGQNARKGTDRG